MLNKHGLSFPPCLIDLSHGIPLTLVSWKQISYLLPICSLKIAPASIGAMSISLMTKLNLSRETFPNTCFTSIEQATKPKSALHSWAAATIKLMAVGISVALPPSSNPKVWRFSHSLSLFPTTLPEHSAHKCPLSDPRVCQSLSSWV